MLDKPIWFVYTSNIIKRERKDYESQDYQKHLGSLKKVLVHH